MFQQGRQPAANAEIEPSAAVGRVGVPKVVALAVGHHFECQLVMVAQKNHPLAGVRNIRCLPHDIGDRETVFLGDSHVHARHQRKMERHVAFVAVAKILLRVFRPLIGLGQQHTPGGMRIERRADPLQDGVCLRQVLVVRPFALDQIGHGVQPQAIDAGVEPEAHDGEHLLQNPWIVEVQVGLMRIKAMPEIRTGHRVPGPVGLFGIEENHPCPGIGLIGVGPYVTVAGR